MTVGHANGPGLSLISPAINCSSEQKIESILWTKWVHVAQTPRQQHCLKRADRTYDKLYQVNSCLLTFKNNGKQSAVSKIDNRKPKQNINKPAMSHVSHVNGLKFVRLRRERVNKET